MHSLQKDYTAGVGEKLMTHSKYFTCYIIKGNCTTIQSLLRIVFCVGIITNSRQNYTSKTCRFILLMCKRSMHRLYIIIYLIAAINISYVGKITGTSHITAYGNIEIEI